MAKHLIFRYTRSGTGYSVIDVYYDDAEADNLPGDYFYVEELGVEIGSGSDILFAPTVPSAVRDLVYKWIDYSVVVNDGNYLNSFSPQSEFPYATRQRQTIEQPEVNDLIGYISGRTHPTSRFLADGQVQIEASGTNQPITAQIGSNEYITGTYNASSKFNVLSYYDFTFTGLAAGTYPWSVKDSKGYIRTGSVTLESQDYIDPASYGVKYYFTYYDNTPSSEGTANQYKVEILLRDFSDSSTELTTFGPDPFLLTQSFEGSDLEEKTIGTTNATVQLVSTTFRQWVEFINADEDDYKVRFSRYEGGSFVKKWEGFLVSEGITEDLYQPPYIINLTFSDRLKDMEVFDFIQFDYQNEGQTLIERIQYCIENTKLQNGYRISVHLWEEDQDDTTDTPLHQTYSTADAYKDKNRFEVLEIILRSFGAIIYSWEGYWYIERLRERKESTVNYLEYDSDLVYVGTGSYSPRAAFRTATGSNGWRWAGRQSQSYSAVYGNVDLIMELGKKEAGFVEAFNINDGWAIQDPTEQGVSFQNLLRNEEARIRIARETTSYTDYIQHTGYIQADIEDLISIEMSALVKIVDNISNSTSGARDLTFRGGYMTIDWSLKVGSYWLDLKGQWSATEVINQINVDSTDTSTKIEIKHPTFGALADEAYILRIYGCNAFGADISATTGPLALDALQAVVTTTLPYGSRRRYRVLDDPDNGDIRINYYELRADDIDTTTNNYKEVKPDDYNSSTNPKKWFLIKQWQYDNSYYDFLGIYGAFTETVITDFDFKLLPNGNEPPDTFTLSERAADNNVRTKEVYLSHFDYPGEINSSKYLYRNGLRLIDGSPTLNWVDANLFNAQPRTLQEHYLRFAKELYVRTRTYLSGTFFADAFITPKNVIYDSGDDGRIFMLTGVTFDYKNRMYTGEVVEIARDTAKEVGDFDSSDFNNADFSV